LTRARTRTGNLYVGHEFVCFFSWGTPRLDVIGTLETRQKTDHLLSPCKFSELEPTPHTRRCYPVSYYALFKGWLLLF